MCMMLCLLLGTFNICFPFCLYIKKKIKLRQDTQSLSKLSSLRMFLVPLFLDSLKQALHAISSHFLAPVSWKTPMPTGKNFLTDHRSTQEILKWKKKSLPQDATFTTMDQGVLADSSEVSRGKQ